MTDPTPVMKAVHTFKFAEDAQPFNGPFAFQHGLDTASLIVTVRDSNGEPINYRTTTQNSTLVIVQRQDGYDWNDGDTIIVMG